MAGTPIEGRESIAEDAYTNSNFTHTLRLFTNVAGEIGQEDALLSDFTEFVGGGYSAVVIDNSEYVTTNGIVTLPTYFFTPTAAWSGITGAYIEDGSRVRHFVYFDQPVECESGEQLKVDINQLVTP